MQSAVENAQYLDIRQIGEQTDQQVNQVETAAIIGENDVVIDVRSAEECEDKPLIIDGKTVLHIPFYKLATAFAALDSDKQYLLYCERGVMSKLQALYLQQQGYRNVKVLKR